MITLTDAAASKIRAMAEQHNVNHLGIRVMVVGGGCSGLTYDMDFEENEGEGDMVIENGDVRVYVDPMSLAYLDGTKIDFVETFSFSGFHFENPNAQKSCGCGSSFTV
ncbi:MAG: iron-sulfur cluster insertion protein ErpA [Myxococcales bacterium]|nr:iron-sulfur cluster insertion protein ErpA [Myxococcales bacterium]MCB9736629.1 iron-sulfur cluster insertion protein ErpA [Deltaproteobacteria bacterium]